MKRNAAMIQEADTIHQIQRALDEKMTWCPTPSALSAQSQATKKQAIAPVKRI
jgi:hypothetical protein